MTSQPQPPMSTALFEQAQKTIPGGVNSPVRAFRSVGGVPRFIASADGAWITDVDGQRYVDYVGSWGPMILGHRPPEVTTALHAQLDIGLSYGAPTEAEITLAELLCERVPGLDQVRLCSSGTEATMSALRLARGATGRDYILKFEGCYHGHGDALLVKAGSGLLTFGVPTSPGVPAELAKYTLTATYNDLNSVDALLAEYGEQLAAIIIEPVAGNMNCILPQPGFLEGLRERATATGAVLIFDEVMTGFRVGPQGAAGVYGITPDLVTLGKIIGGGLPMGAFGGRLDLMQHLSPVGPVYQAGTLSGNPMAVTAGLATLRRLADTQIYSDLAAYTERLCAGLQAEADAAGVTFTTARLGSMFGLFFGSGPIHGYADVMACDSPRFNRFFHAMLERGVYLAPSAFEAGFVSHRHGEAELKHTLSAAREAFQQAQ